MPKASQKNYLESGRDGSSGTDGPLRSVTRIIFESLKEKMRISLLIFEGKCGLYFL